MSVHERNHRKYESIIIFNAANAFRLFNRRSPSVRYSISHSILQDVRKHCPAWQQTLVLFNQLVIYYRITFFTRLLFHPSTKIDFSYESKSLKLYLFLTSQNAKDRFLKCDERLNSRKILKLGGNYIRTDFIEEKERTFISNVEGVPREVAETKYLSSPSTI